MLDIIFLYFHVIVIIIIIIIWTTKSIYGTKLIGFVIIVSWNIICNNSNGNEFNKGFLNLLKDVFFFSDDTCIIRYIQLSFIFSYTYEILFIKVI